MAEEENTSFISELQKKIIDIFVVSHPNQHSEPTHLTYFVQLLSAWAALLLTL